MMKNALASLSIALLVASSAFAAEHSKEAKEHDGPCKADRAKFCGGKKWGHGLGKCLKGHEAELSASCKGMMAKRKDNKNEIHEEEAEARSEKGDKAHE